MLSEPEIEELYREFLSVPSDNTEAVRAAFRFALFKACAMAVYDEQQARTKQEMEFTVTKRNGNL